MTGRAGKEWTLALLAVPVTAAVTDSMTARAAGVASVHPQGEVAAVQQVAVRFDAAVPFGELRLPDPMAVACKGCAPPGSGRSIDARSWAFDFRQRFPPATAARQPLQLAAGWQSLGGALTGTTRFNFSIGGPAVVRVWPYDGSRVDEDPHFLLRLTGPVAWALAQQVSLKPAVGASLERVLDLDDRTTEVSSVTFAKPLADNARFTIELPVALKDGAGRPLANAASFPLGVATGEAPPMAKFSAAPVGVIQRADPAVLPVTLHPVPGDLRPAASGGQERLRRLDAPADILACLGRLQRFPETRLSAREAGRPEAPPGGRLSLPWPAAAGALDVAQQGSGQPWLTVANLVRQAPRRSGRAGGPIAAALVRGLDASPEQVAERACGVLTLQQLEAADRADQPAGRWPRSDQHRRRPVPAAKPRPALPRLGQRTHPAGCQPHRAGSAGGCDARP